MSIVNIQLRSTTILHDALHGFRKGRGTGTATTEGKLEQKLAGIVHKPLLQIFIDVWKAYDFLYGGRCKEILRGYILGPNLQWLLQQNWDRQKVVLKEENIYGRPLIKGRGVT